MRRLPIVTLAWLVVSAGVVAQGGVPWIECPINGHFYARLPVTDSWGASNNIAAGLGLRLATIRNAAENAWLVANVAQGQECWIDLHCDRTWYTGWPVDYVPPGSDAPNCSSLCSGQQRRYVLMSDGSWDLRCSADDKYAIIELVTNDLYTWSAISAPAAPSARYGAAMSFDSWRGRTVLFGGYDLLTRNDTWEWSSQGWAPRLLATNPPARFRGGMAFDAVHGASVLFGGDSGSGLLDDTWKWDGNTWAQVNSAVSPSARWGHSMSFDFVRGRIVMFGGQTATAFLSDTWEFDGSQWTQVFASGPSPRFGTAMFFEAINQRTVLFGGKTFNSVVSDETWAFDGSAWTQLNPSVRPPGREVMSYAYDSLRSRAVIVGGAVNGANKDDVWYFRGTQWYRLHSVPRPTGRREASMVFHEDRLFLVGGYTNVPVLDQWAGRLLNSVRYFGVGCGSPAVTIQAAPGSAPVLGTTLQWKVSNIPGTALLSMMSIGFSRTSYGPFALPLALDGIAMPGCTLYHDVAYRLGEVCTPTAVGTSSFDVPIPPVLSLVGVHMIFQPWVFDVQANPTGVLTGNAADAMFSRY